MTDWIDLDKAQPRAFSSERGREAVETVAPPAPLRPLIEGVAGSSPYLARLCAREADWLGDALLGSPSAAFAPLLAPLDEIGVKHTSEELRRRKRRMALCVALADLGGGWTLRQTTEALTRFADFAVETAFRAALGVERSGPLAGLAPEDAGLIAIAMGKTGAGELNYSSDIDLILLFDDERAEDIAESRQAWTRASRRVIKLLSEVDAQGYVFRTDLRLRPNPSVTPICAPLGAAERYYEHDGRTWERAAFIKARAAAGDIPAGRAFLDRLAPFIWRRHLDFAALEDINDIRAMIRDAKGVSARRDLPGLDIKLCPGGIREIEFFAQTQQLAYGGRDASLRRPATCDALKALAAAGRVSEEDETALAADYTAHRRLEHLFQMIGDAQTHAMPVSEEARAQIAALGGWESRAAMEAETADRLARVRARVERFFARSGAAPGPEAQVERAIGDGFADPDKIREMTTRWAHGDVAATRDERARRKIRALTPEILTRLRLAGDPDAAALQFDRFLNGLPAGVQLFSLFEANPHLLDLLAEICAAAPALADYLARNSAVLDAVLDAGFFERPPDRDALTAELEALIAGAQDYEGALNAARRWAKERRFQIGVHVLRGLADAREAGAGFSDVAEACLVALKPVVEAEFARRHGPPPGRGAVVIGMGKLGGREMTAASDLDLIIVYDPAGAEMSDGEKPLLIGPYYARLTQKLISALTAPTAEGTLYEVDMRLRPSGKQGPLAVRLEAFRSYQREEAWTWEHMALTRARVVAGPSDLAQELEAVIEEVLTLPRDAAKVRADIGEMRGRVAKAHAGARDEIWALKHAAGGLMDIEFSVQAGLLSASIRGARAPAEALSELVAAGVIPEDEAAILAEAHALQSRLQHLERVAAAGAFRIEAAGEGLRRALARIGGVEDAPALEARIAELRAQALKAVDRIAPIP